MIKNRSTAINKLVNDAEKILIIQADNPDGDSIASSMALEAILSKLGKEIFLYCGVEVPYYLRYIDGWSRISKEIPNDFDLSIIVDTSASILLGKIKENNLTTKLSKKPLIVLDHHKDVMCDIDYATLVVNDPSFASTGELIFNIAQKNKWPLDKHSSKYILISILSDTLGLSSESASSDTFRTVAKILDMGVNRSKIEEERKELSKMDEKVYRYKAELIKRTRFYHNNQIALVSIPEDELFDVGTLYNPGPLINNDLLMVKDVDISIIIKIYKNKITGSIRSSYNQPIANKIAENYGGGGHPNAAGFKIEDFNEDLEIFTNNLIKEVIKLI